MFNDLEYKIPEGNPNCQYTANIISYLIDKDVERLVNYQKSLRISGTFLNPVGGCNFVLGGSLVIIAKFKYNGTPKNWIFGLITDDNKISRLELCSFHVDSDTRTLAKWAELVQPSPLDVVDIVEEDQVLRLKEFLHKYGHQYYYFLNAKHRFALHPLGIQLKHEDINQLHTSPIKFYEHGDTLHHNNHFSTFMYAFAIDLSDFISIDLDSVVPSKMNKTISDRITLV